MYGSDIDHDRGAERMSLHQIIQTQFPPGLPGKGIAKLISYV
jgi:hypothetical protein